MYWHEYCMLKGMYWHVYCMLKGMYWRLYRVCTEAGHTWLPPASRPLVCSSATPPARLVVAYLIPL